MGRIWLTFYPDNMSYCKEGWSAKIVQFKGQNESKNKRTDDSENRGGRRQRI